MTGQELAHLIQDGVRPVVTFKKPVEDQEAYMEAGMRGRLIGVDEKADGIIKIRVDLSEFDDFNKALESSNYYDKQGVARLTAREAGLYEPIEDVYVSSASEVVEFMVEEAESVALHEEFKRLQAAAGASAAGPADPGLLYVQWLEQTVVALRRAQQDSQGEAAGQTDRPRQG